MANSSTFIRDIGSPGNPITTRIVGAAVLVASLFVHAGSAQENEAEKILRQRLGRIRIGLGELVVPGNDPEQLGAFLTRIQQLETEVSADYREAIKRFKEARNEAASRSLARADELSDDQFYLAGRIGIPSRVLGVKGQNAEEREFTAAMALRFFKLALAKQSSRELNYALSLPVYLEREGSLQLAHQVNRELAATLRGAAEADRYQRQLTRLDEAARRLAPLIEPLQLEGSLLSGGRIQWDRYDGKPIALLFWSAAQEPTSVSPDGLMRRYRYFHDRGFEVVGVCLDHDRETARNLVRAEDVPWPNLFEADAGFNHPLATKYAVSEVPTTFLFDREGTLVSSTLNGFAAEKKFADLLGPLTSDARDSVIAGDWDKAGEQMKAWSQKDGFDIYEAGKINAGYLVTLLAGGKTDEFRTGCRKEWENQANLNEYVKAKLIRVCCLTPDCGIPMGELRKAAEALHESNKNNVMREAHMRTLYRSGEYEKALALARGPGDSLQGLFFAATRAKCLKKLGQDVEARTSLEDAIDRYKSGFADLNKTKPAGHLSDHWISCLMAKAVIQEAEQIVNNNQ